jgi:hypothetical protein
MKQFEPYRDREQQREAEESLSSEQWPSNPKMFEKNRKT